MSEQELREAFDRALSHFMAKGYEEDDRSFSDWSVDEFILPLVRTLEYYAESVPLGVEARLTLADLKKKLGVE